MKKAFINIDYTNDFVADDGKLTCGKPGQAIEERIVSLSREFLESGDYVVLAVDLHDERDNFHPESSLFPPHNIRGTKGRELYRSLNEWYKENEESASLIYLDKTRYSAFSGTNLETKLRERDIKDVYLAGVCTDICVLHTAVDAYNKGFSIHIYEDAVASFNENGHQWALNHFKNSLGAKILSKGVDSE
ncbi:isochorismatase family protein [Bacillus lacus]|uniref:Isochorismatase family protein n=1 Tax=Metabacillus lacus TaxID=1983721 RepID=A0A7X2J161_9BACI|nr:isochorismatase family protein [Metabacillus lacus]